MFLSLLVIMTSIFLFIYAACLVFSCQHGKASRASKWVGCFPFDLLWRGLYKIGVFSCLEFLFRIQYVNVDWKGELSTVQFLKQFSFLFLLGLVCCMVSSKAPASQPCNGQSGWRLSPPSCECVHPVLQARLWGSEFQADRDCPTMFSSYFSQTSGTTAHERPTLRLPFL